MRWDELPSSENVEDRRGEGGGGGGMPLGYGGLGIGGLIILGIISYALGIDPRLLIGGGEVLNGDRERPSQSAPTHRGTPTDETGRFVADVLGSTEVVWKGLFNEMGREYRPPILVMFSGATQSACGFAQAAMGPFYCPSDRRVYLDTTFFRDLETRFGGCERGSKACRFSQAYVIAHEVGHHVQNLLGSLNRVQQQQHAVSRKDANHLQVLVELQADCFAGVWANRSEQKWHLIEPGDVESALRTASAIGDDRLQKARQGYVVPDAFTHGSSADRVRWFKNGLEGGRTSSCDTFASAERR